MFTPHNTHSYEQVPRCDSDEERNFRAHSQANSAISITDLLRQTAARRMRQIEDSLIQNHHQNDAVMPIASSSDSEDLEDPENESSHLISKQPTSVEMHEVNLDQSHAPSQSEDDETEYDDFVFLLFLDGTKKRVGVLSQWTVSHFKARHFRHELADNKKVRLIYRGKMLTDLQAFNSYHIPTDGFIHVSISKNGALYRQTRRDNGEGSIDGDYENFDDGMDDEAVARRLQQQEMAQFGMMGQMGPYGPMFGGMRRPGMNRPLGGPFGQREDPNEDPELRRIRERKEFLCGMFLGSVAGIWILVFLILAARQGNYSRRFRLGITVGVAINLMVQLTFHEPIVPHDADGDAENGISSADGTGLGDDITADVPVVDENSAAS